MLGWEFFVCPERLRGSPNEPTLAIWRSGFGGTRWVDDLCAQGKAKEIERGGYPNRYTLPARTLLGILYGGIPRHTGPTVIGEDYVHPPGWTERVKVDFVELEKLDPDELLAVEAWDQS